MTYLAANMEASSNQLSLSPATQYAIATDELPGIDLTQSVNTRTNNSVSKAWLALAASLGVHLLLLQIEREPAPQVLQPDLQVVLRMQAAATETQTQIPEPDTRPQPSETTQTQELPSSPTTAKTAATPPTATPTANNTKAAAGTPPAINKAPEIYVPPRQTSARDSGTVFNPAMRQKLEQARQFNFTAPTEPAGTTYTDISGAQQVDINGKCMRENTTTAGRHTNWYLTSCNTDHSEGGKIMRGLQQRLQHMR